MSGQASSADAARAGLRNRAAATKASTLAKGSGRGAGGSSAGVLRFYTDDSPGIKVGPTVVLIASLSFIGLVVLLHIWGKIRS